MEFFFELSTDRLLETPEVSLGGHACTSVTVADAPDDKTTVTCTASGAPPGIVSVTVRLPTIGSAAVPDTLTFEYVVAITAIASIVTTRKRRHVMLAWVRDKRCRPRPIELLRADHLA